MFYEALTSLEARAGITPPTQYNSSAKPFTPQSKSAANTLPSSSKSEDSILLSVSDKLISPHPVSDFRTEEVVLPYIKDMKPSFDGAKSSPAAVEPAAVSEEDLLIKDVDSLVASLAYVARPTEKQRMIARLSTLREQLVKVSAHLNRPPSVL